MFPTIISYYTENTPYEEEVKGLIASCEKHNLPYSIDSIPNFGSWEANCCFKPQYILKKLTDLKRPVLWIDADAIVFRKPTIFETLKADVAIYINKALPDHHSSQMPSGTIFFNHTENAFTILKEWEKETKRCLSLNPNHWDQISLCTALLNSSASIFALEESYYQIYNKIRDKKKKETT